MKLKRIAALSAVVFGLLAVPATAMASTSGGPIVAVAVELRCPLPHLLPPGATGAVTIVPSSAVPSSAVPSPAASISAVPATGVRIVCCGLVKPGNRPYVRACPPLTLVFDMRAGSSTITEVHGPRLFVHEPILYRGGFYTIRSVRGDKFTLDFRGRLFVNHGPAIHDGRAVVVRGEVFLSGRMCSK
jgi:hypothetical protein